MSLRVRVLNSKATVPTRGSEASAGLDLYASEPLTLKAHGRGVVKTGISVAVPTGTYGRVAPRSGLAVNHGIDTGAGVIDADYRGEVCVALFNHGDEDYTIRAGDRVAQLIIEKIWMGNVMVVETLDDTARAAGGFGSTGV